MQALERVDDDAVSGVGIGLNVCKTEQLGHLTGSDLDGGTSHETSYGGSRNELDDETETQQTDAESDDTTKEGECTCDDIGGPFFAVCLDMLNDVENLERHDSDGTDSNILGGGEEGIDHDTNEGRVKTEFRGETGEFSVRHRLRNDDEGDGDTGDDISKKPGSVVGADPFTEREKRIQVFGGLRTRVAKDVGEPVSTANDGNTKTADLVVIVADHVLEGI